MNTTTLRTLTKGCGTLALALATLSLVACGGDSDNDDDTFSYRISLTNLTAGQPLSPLAVVLHDADWRALQVGEPASVALENLAESGAVSDLLAQAEAADSDYATMTGAGIILPGASETLEIETDASGTFFLTLLSMLVNTNDGIVALNGADLEGLAVGDQLTLDLMAYDAGTEANSESADTVPGPAATGGLREGFNASRDDIRDEVFAHAGVVTSDDGLTRSVLTEAHRWQSPVARVVVRRIE
ncbi:MAG: spondin domain-containing protein [Ketobacteraceae bacterium]|nr:spondin domain-containing protein [Ketobacteraceae bacterium]